MRNKTLNFRHFKKREGFRGLSLNQLGLILALAFLTLFLAVFFYLSKINLGFTWVFLSLFFLFSALIFLSFLSLSRKEIEHARAYQSHSILNISQKTLPFFREGLTRHSAQEVAKIVKKEMELLAVAVTDRQNILAFVGAGEDHHLPGSSFITAATKRVLKSGEIEIIREKKDIGCPVKSCPLEAAVIVPLRKKGKIIGSLKFYYSSAKDIDENSLVVAEGLKELLENQLELSEIANLEKMAREAELRALQAQINPHFFFNVLNTAVAYCRTDPMEVRKLLLNFSDFFRHTLELGEKNLITLKEELNYLETYLFLEKARFGHRLDFKIENQIGRLSDWLIPPFTLQPLVENSINYAFPEEGQLVVEVWLREKDKEVEIVVADNGVGIPRKDLEKILDRGFGKGLGLGLNLINARLKSLFGEDYGLKVESELGKGTKVFLNLPKLVGDKRKALARLPK